MSDNKDLNAILVGLGANLPGAHGMPRATLEAALQRLGEEGVRPARVSRFWRTRPQPDDGQPWYVNAVAAVETALPPADLLALLLAVEAEFGRVRGARNAPRVLDLDLVAHGRLVLPGPEGPILPHPRMRGRAFVLRPLAEVVPRWSHPVTGESVAELLEKLPPGQDAVPTD